MISPQKRENTNIIFKYVIFLTPSVIVMSADNVVSVVQHEQS